MASSPVALLQRATPAIGQAGLSAAAISEAPHAAQPKFVEAPRPAARAARQIRSALEALHAAPVVGEQTLSLLKE
ncbi:MAG: hypothetical protein JO331_04365 [Verrucomicrobia bacterium]|nr:hypothetical protein [Verrucomicrobiota bacterium]